MFNKSAVIFVRTNSMQKMQHIFKFSIKKSYSLLTGNTSSARIKNGLVDKYPGLKKRIIPIKNEVTINEKLNTNMQQIESVT